MAKLGQSSFRRILLSRILLLSIPVLLVGEAVTYRKARSGLLETARQNLTESAIRKRDSIQASITALQSNLVTASTTSILQSGSPKDIQSFLERLSQQLPAKVQCAQLTNLQTGNIIANTCDLEIISAVQVRNLWPQRQVNFPPDRSQVQILPAGRTNPADPTNSRGQLGLVLSAPVYNAQGELQHVLSVRSALHQQEGDRPKSLSGQTVVIDQDGTILAHPNAEHVGRKIQQEPDAERLTDILHNAIAGDSDVRHLFSFEENGTEWLAGYSSVRIPVSVDAAHIWVVMAVTRLDNALYSLKEIKHVLVVLTIVLIATNLFATLYLARDLALPLEQLGGYALHVQRRHPATKTVTVLKAQGRPSFHHPQDFKIRELSQLAEALNSMVARMEERAEELESAWEQAKAANQLKNEFLANTSHELRTPLNAIIGCIRLVRDGCCDDREEEMDFLQRADDAAIHLLNIINDLLDIAKIEAGTLSITTEPTDLRLLLKEVIDLQAVHIQQKGLQLNLPDLQEAIAVQADPAKLKQVLLNVVYNAVKFTDHGSITISIRRLEAPDVTTATLQSELPEALTHPVSHQDTTAEALHSPETLAPKNTSPTNSHQWVVVTVQDTGIGIEPSQQHKLFRPFVMVDGTTTRRFEGTGLGLAISRNLVQLMGGTITLHSTGINQGTTVEVSLPLIDSSLLSAAKGSSVTRVPVTADVQSI